MSDAAADMPDEAEPTPDRRADRPLATGFHPIPCEVARRASR